MRRVITHIPIGMPMCLEFIMCVSCIWVNFPNLPSCKQCNFCMFGGLVIMSSTGVDGKPVICTVFPSLMGIQNLLALLTHLLRTNRWGDYRVAFGPHEESSG